jgi:hypothetical protein
MPQVANLKTTSPSITNFDKAHKEEQVVLKTNNAKENTVTKTQFQIDCERGYSVETARANMHKRLAKLWEIKK